MNKHMPDTDTDDDTRLLSVCPDCGTPFARDDGANARCLDCRPTRRAEHRARVRIDRRSPHELGYDYRWRKLSRRARRMQPFCSDCGSVHDLTADHSPEAWARHDAGLPIRLQDIDVVCRRCNSARGPARGDDAVPRPAKPSVPDLADLAEDSDPTGGDMGRTADRWHSNT